MNIIKTSIGLTKTIRNVSRFNEILSVLAKYGFGELIINSKLNLVIPNFVMPRASIKISKEDLSDYDFWKSVGHSLRLAFEELGPSFIKFGQLLSTREDILNPALIKELKKLQDRVSPVEFSITKAVIERELKGKLEELFVSINEKPIGVASIGMVYQAVLKDGTDVVIKVRRPKIKKNLMTDFEIIGFIVGSIEKVSDDFKFLGASRVVDDFFKNINLELNYYFEANNSIKLKKNLERLDKGSLLQIPTIYKELSTEKILVMEYLKGKPFNKISNIKDYPELERNLLTCVRYFLHTMLSDGFFHADLHGGNFFQLENDRIGLIDFGLVGNLSKKNRTRLVAILYAMLSNNYENLVYEFLDVAEYEQIPNHEQLERDLREGLTPFIGLSVQEVDATVLTHTLVSILSRHQIYLPREWFIIFRAIMTLDGVGKSLNIDLNIFEIIDDEIGDILGELVSKDALLEDSIWLGRDLISSLRIVPRHLSWALKEFAKKNYTVDIKLVGIEKEVGLLTRSMYFVGLMILSSVFFLSGILIIGQREIMIFSDLPVLSIVSFSLSAVTLARAILLSRIK